MSHLEMKMWPGHAACAAHLADRRTLEDDVSDANETLRAVRVTRHQTAAVIDLDHITILRMVLRRDDHPGRGRKDRASGPGHEVDAVVERTLAVEGVEAPAEVGSVDSGPDRKHRGQ